MNRASATAVDFFSVLIGREARKFLEKDKPPKLASVATDGTLSRLGGIYGGNLQHSAPVSLASACEPLPNIHACEAPAFCSRSTSADLERLR